MRSWDLPCRTPKDRKSTRLNSSHLVISYAVFCLKKKTLKVCNAHQGTEQRHRNRDRRAEQTRAQITCAAAPIVDMGSGQGYGCFFFNDTATTEIYTLSLHDALPI